MIRIDIRPRFVLDYTVGLYGGSVEVVTRDIGATIGTEILDANGGRLCAYRPGTRYSDRAKEIAEDHLREALGMLVGGGSLPPVQTLLPEALATALRTAVSGEQQWVPGEEDSW
ncbi:hypothetical protein [Streptomyces fulvorobeus]|uniref:Uncharacterized protein n=1 Tax=Streptomyces fulvorobeus TaxID=284028 RepID=A0A7J0CG31_9ACTN|nr:hypothetical protein [Streptomyces fulvorobeus]NYE44230.1 hypothetical protein [Streptomyces fulvorobeus]GFN00745.1 hypothetical protein Sfulv_55550 [Streptomyces fulvorobeus]